MKLVIVESYNKIKSIKKFLGNDYEVIASGGHIRELKNSGYGFNKETLMPIWEVYNKNKSDGEKTIRQLKSTAKEAEEVFLATDPDREGEAISWHLYDILDKKDQSKCHRITFNEITKKAIDNAMTKPRDIDLNLVYSQWARRILDRMVGYGLSSLVKSKLNAISAGRVQSVALLFIVERYLQIKNFVSENWWTIEATLDAQDKEKQEIPIFLRETSFPCETFGPKSLSEYKFAKEEEAKKCLDMLGPKYTVYKIDEPTLSHSKILEPFQTDTLLSTAYSKLGWSTSRTQKLSQELYNGIDIDGSITSLISYPRTDTNRLNDDFIVSTRKYISDNYGSDYVATSVKAANTGPLVQGAHEGIRPIDITITPKSLTDKIRDKDASNLLKLYTLIWTRTVAAFMKNPLYKEFILRFINNDQKFYTSYKKLFFKGYYALPHYSSKNIDSNIDLSHLKVGDELVETKKVAIIKHETQPSPLFNEGTLVKELKKSGVGRPSTYSTMVNIVKSRGYVDNAKELSPTDIGILLIENLTKEFGEFISKKFTANMESELDLIAEGKENWNNWVRAFKEKFDNSIKLARETMEKIPEKLVGRKCPKCNNELIYQKNKRDRSEFIGCMGYKDGCKYTESLTRADTPKAKPIDRNCPKCNAQLLERYNKRGEPFIGCSSFPKCRFIESIKKPVETKEEKND